MSKATLVSAVLSATPTITSKADAERAVDAVVKGITLAARAGDKVVLPGFGTFEAKKRGARMARNLRTGEPIEVAAKTVLNFKSKLSL